MILLNAQKRDLTRFFFFCISGEYSGFLAAGSEHFYMRACRESLWAFHSLASQNQNERSKNSLLFCLLPLESRNRLTLTPLKNKVCENVLTGEKVSLQPQILRSLLYIERKVPTRTIKGSSACPHRRTLLG